MEDEYTPAQVRRTIKGYRKRYKPATIPSLVDLCLLTINRHRGDQKDVLFDSAPRLLLPKEVRFRFDKAAQELYEMQSMKKLYLCLFSFEHGNSVLGINEEVIVKRGLKRKRLEIEVKSYYDQELLEELMEAGSRGELSMVKFLAKDQQGEKKQIKIFV